MTKKMTLDLDTLAVESFAAETADAARGTVWGAEDTLPTEMYCSVKGCPTYQNTCESRCNNCDTVEPYC